MTSEDADARAPRQHTASGDRSLDSPGDRGPDVPGDRGPDVPGDRGPDVSGDRTPDSPGDRTSDSPPGRTPDSRGGVGPFGAVLAGGESSRYGSPKALATVGGKRIIDRVVEALRTVTSEIILSANEPALFRDLGLPIYPDEREGLGPLGGIYTALLRAREAGRPGVLAVACDMPFPSTSLLALLRTTAFGPAAGADLVLPASRGRRGVEPLFGAYRTTCLSAIDAALAEGDRRMIGFHERVDARTIPLDVVESLCDPERAFMNVNTPGDRARAERIAAGHDAAGHDAAGHDAAGHERDGQARERRRGQARERRRGQAREGRRGQDGGSNG